MPNCPKCGDPMKYHGFYNDYSGGRPAKTKIRFYCEECEERVFSPPIEGVTHSQIQRDPDLVKKRDEILQVLDQKIEELGQLLLENVDYLTKTESFNMNQAIDEQLYGRVRFLIYRNNPEPGSRVCCNCGITDEDCSNILEFDEGEFLCCACAFYVGCYWCEGKHKGPRERGIKQLSLTDGEGIVL